MTCPLNLPQKESEYMKMKKKLYKKFFQDLLTLFSIMPVVELTRGLVLADSALFFSTLATLIVEVTLGLIVLRMNKHQEVAITIFIVLFITASLVTNYYGQTQFFKSIHGTFHYSSATTAFMYAIGNRIPKFSHRAAYNTSLLIIKLVVVLVDDLSTLPGHAIILSFCIYLDYDREKHDQKLFDSNFYSKEQLTKFKDLVVDEIPDSMAIVTQDLHRCLFTNTAWNALFEGECNSSIIDCMKKFSIQENLNDESLEDSIENGNFMQKQTLLGFIQDQKGNGKEKQISKAACNVLYCKNAIQEKSDSFDGLTSPSQFSFEAKILPLIWDEQPALGIILHDITQQDMLLRLKTAANVQKDKILATVSHELRTPLNGMLGMIQFMQKEIKDSNILHYLKLCSNSGNLLLGIVNSILDLNMIKANKLKLSIESLEIKSFLEDFLKLFEFQCQQKGLFLKLNISHLVPKYIKTDKNRLSQILLNLIGNAFKFTETGGITVSVGPSRHRKEYISCTVEDTGLGIKKEDQPKLFKMFGKLEENRQKNKGTIVNSQGVGLGLTISDSLARILCISKDLGGIKVKSEYHKGSKFSFIINQNLEISEEKALSSERRASSESFDEGDTGINETGGYKYRRLAGKKSLDWTSNSTQFLSFEESKIAKNDHINPLQKYQTISNIGWPMSCPSPVHKRKQASVLIVDDNPLNITVVELLLRRHKFNVKSALSGQEALKLLQNNDYKQEPIVVILMDLQMPIMDGYQTSKKIKSLMIEKKIPEIPIIALTANDTENDKKSCLKAGMIGHLSKPLKEEDLAKILKRHE